MLYKKTFFCYLFCFGLNYSNAQPRLDSLYALASVQSFGTILVPHRDYLILIGHGTNDNPFNSYGTLFSKIGLDGTVLASTFTLDSNKFREYYNLNAVVLDTSLYLIFNGTQPNQLLKFNINTSQIESREYLGNQIHQDGFIHNFSINLIDSQSLLINSTVLNTANKLSTQLSIYNTLEDTFTYYFNSNATFDQIITKAIQTSDGFILSGFIRLRDSNDEYIYKATIIWTDYQFVENKRYISSSSRLEGFGYDIVMKEEKSIVATNCVGHKMDLGFGDDIPVWRPSIYCVDSIGKLTWQTEMGYPHFGEIECVFNALIPSNSNDGYIAAGAQANFSATDYYFGDTTNAAGEIFRFDALIAKVSNEGDSLWSRHYYTSDFLFSNAIIFDIIPHPEGGYVLTGWANKHKLEPGKPANYTWLFFIDEFGCIVPGCQEIVNSEDIYSPSLIRLSPNPAQDVLYIYHQENDIHLYHILNAKGELIRKFQMDNAGSTFLLDVSNYVPGTYFITKFNKRGNHTTERWIKL